MERFRTAIKRTSVKVYLKTRIILFFIWLISLYFAWNYWKWAGVFPVWVTGQLLDNILKQIEKQNLDY